MLSTFLLKNTVCLKLPTGALVPVVSSQAEMTEDDEVLSVRIVVNMYPVSLGV